MSAHPLVRETFRPLAMGAAEVAAEATLTGVPAGTIASREDGLRVVEAIELLLDADQWQAADDLYQSRTDDGEVWKTLPAARLGQRAASAFVATPARRQACVDHLTPTQIWGSTSTRSACTRARRGSGDRAGVPGRRRPPSAADTEGSFRNLSTGLRNLTECLRVVGGGRGSPAGRGRGRQPRRQHPLMTALSIDPSADLGNARYTGDGCRCWPATARAAEEQFLAADRLQYTSDSAGEGDHLFSLAGYLVGGVPGPHRPIRTGPAVDRAQPRDQHRDRIGTRTWPAATGYSPASTWPPGIPRSAGRRLTAAAATFRDGDYLVELAATLPVLADSARAAGDLDAAARHVEEALSITGPRGLLLSHAAALTVRARTCADRVAAGSREHLGEGGTPPRPPSGSRPATGWPGRSWTPWTPTPTSTRPRVSTTAGRGRRPRCGRA